MVSNKTGTLVLLSGPSCVGKTPLVIALNKFYPDLGREYDPLVIYNSREARPGEKDCVDYHFLTEAQIESLKSNDQYIVIKARNDLQAIDLNELRKNLDTGNVIYEGNPVVARLLLSHPDLKAIKKLSIFMSPLSRSEIKEYQLRSQDSAIEKYLTQIMKEKILRRAQSHKTELTGEYLADVELRASSAYAELKEAHYYDYVIPNHDGEDSDHWKGSEYPIGDAKKALDAFVHLVQTKESSIAENWEADLIT